MSVNCAICKCLVNQPSNHYWLVIRGARQNEGGWWLGMMARVGVAIQDRLDGARQDEGG